MLMDKEICTDFKETLCVIRLDMKEEIMPDDLPEIFLDPLLYTPIRNPVILPDSKIIMDREVIEAHLVENEYDPFNRNILTKDQLDEYNREEGQQMLCLEFIQKRNDWIKTNHYQKYSVTE
jgi:hypothetical protein